MQKIIKKFFKKSKFQKLSKFWKILVGVGFFVLAAVGFFVFRNNNQAEAGWWDDNWHYRNSFTITNNTNAESNVYASSTIDTSLSGKFQADCGDLRFTNEAGQLLNYYIVTGCGTAAANIHINFESFPAGAQTIYFYYGNPSAPDGFANSDFSTEASDYTIGSAGSEEVGPGPVGYWSFDEGYGTTAYDETSNGNDGTLTNGPVWQDESMCVSGKCLYFDGSDDYADIGDTNQNVGTIGFWMRATSTTGSIIDLDGGTHTITASSGTLSAGGFSSPTIYVDGKVSSTIEANKWHYVAISTATSFEASDFDIGRVSANYFGGFLDEVKIYPYARTADEVKQDYNAGVAGVKASKGTALSMGGKSDQWLSDGLVGYWKMDEASWNGTAGEVTDASGNGNDGTASGNASTTVGKYGSGGVFDGDGDYTSISNFQFPISNQFSISGWLNVQTLATAKSIISQWGGSQNNILIKTDDSSSDELRICVASGLTDNCTNYGYTIDANLTADTWKNLQVVYDGTQSANADKLKLFINGSQKTLSFSGTIPATIQTGATSALEIGGNSNLTTYLATKSDEVRVYNRALSPREVRDLYEWAPGPVGHWKFDEKTGTTAYDSSGNGNDCAFNTDTEWANGKYGSAVDLDGGTAAALDCGPFQYLNTMTVSAWVKRGTNGNVKMITKTGGNWVWELIYGSNSYAYFNINGTNTGNISVPIDNQWHYFTGAYDKSNIMLYVDGVLKSSVAYTGDVNTYSYNLGIGDRITGGSTDFGGAIDDVRIYNYARTQKQIIEDMNAGHPAGGSPISSKLGHWKFDEGFGTTAYDSGFGGNDLTLSSASWTMSGKFGKAFSGGDNLRVADSGDNSDFDFGATDSFSLSAWVKYGTTNPSATEYILHKQTGNEGYALYMDTEGDLIFGIGDTSSASFPEDKAGDLGSDWADDSWHHLVGTKNSNSDIKIYIDGELKETDSSLAADATLENAATLYIGDANATDGTDEFLGDIDEVKIYNYALTEDEVRLDYNQGKAMVLGSKGTESDGATASFSASREYCVPGDTATCNPPVGHWKFDEKTGTTAYDVSGNGNDGTLGGGTTAYEPSWTRGKYGSALDFDGSDDFTDVGDTSQNINSISFWLKPDSTTEDIIDLDGGTHTIEITSGTLSATGFSSPTIYVDGQASTAIDTSWHHITIKTATAIDANNLDIGRVSTSYFGGLIDDVRIYDYARTPAQIAWEYNRGAPVGHWKFDEGEGTVAHDYSENGNDGTLTNMDASTDWVSGKVGDYGLDFDGTDDFTDIGDTSQNINTISFWLKPDSTTEDIIDLDGGTHTIEVSSGTLSATGFSFPTIYVDAGQSSTIDTNWHHITIKTATAIDANNLDIGRVSTSYFDGQIDDVRIYNYALNEYQIKQVYNEGNAVNIK